MENSLSRTSNKRATALDALRGFAILMMVLSGTIRYGILPAWMYHAQEPPPTHNFNGNLPGLTWVDIVFPIFLFSLGAAIPLALSRRLARGFSNPQVIFYIFKRGFLLAAFAIFLQHLRPHVISSNAEDMSKWWLGLLGFLLLFLMFVRLPKSFKFGKYSKLINLIAWFVSLLLISQIHYPQGIGLSLERSDIILIALANMAVFGSLSWLFTRNNLLLRLGLLGLLLALRFSASSNSWISEFWSYSPVPWIFRWDYLKYLFIVIPGTIAGDAFLNWIHAPKDEEDNIASDRSRYPCFFGMIILMSIICIVLLIGLQARLVLETTIVSVILCLASWFLINKPTNSTEDLIKVFYQWGVYWLVLGLLFEPVGGGIKKDPSTLSYYFVTTGISLFILIIFTIITDLFKNKKILQLLINNGQNPMIAYVGFANLIWPILNLTQLEKRIIDITNEPIMGFLKGIVTTLVIALIVSFLTRKKLVWRT